MLGDTSGNPGIIELRSLRLPHKQIEKLKDQRGPEYFHGALRLLSPYICNKNDPNVAEHFPVNWTTIGQSSRICSGNASRSRRHAFKESRFPHLLASVQKLTELFPRSGTPTKSDPKFQQKGKYGCRGGNRFVKGGHQNLIGQLISR